ncbi:mitochondrial matrix Mmp37-domain-containing protein [Mrakia frigida]|uniref:putative phosphatidate cytidylyltransferase n=1 Tax=Mrakia frigida TaxID=29902 RepID=UPI003FCC06D0
MLVSAQKQARSSASKALKQAACYSTPSTSSSSSSSSSDDALLAQTTTSKPSPTVTNGPPRSTLATHVKLPTNLSSPPKPQILRPYRPRTPLFPSAARPKIQLPTGFGENQMVSLPDSTLSLLNTIVGSFKDAPIRYAFAYGSGIFSQGGPTTAGKEGGGGEKPMLDFIFATTHADHFHSINMQNNPSHYPAYMRAMGSGAVSWIQEHGGAGVWFNADVPVEGVRIKYGVVTMDHLCKDLIEWQTLYLSGRMHKPIRIIKDDPRVKLANQVNLASALRVALLTLPENFSERELYTRIAGLSYGGDFRMSVPGAENPRKIHNIVDSQMDKFKGVYGRLLSELDGLAVVGQDHSPEHRASLARKLPKTLKTGIRAKYADASRDQTESSAEKELWLKIGGEESLGHELIRQTSQITRRPALTQSIKGIITAGPLKSLHYSWAKVGKWQKGKKELEEVKRKQAEEEKTKGL